MSDFEELKGKRVLVTGGGGFIGSHLVDGLCEVGAQVRVLDNFSTGHKKNLAHREGQIEVIEGDIRDLDTCLRACDKVSKIYHQAALGSVPRSMDEPATSIAINVGGTVNIFTAARDKGVKRVVYASSSSVYGDNDALPKREGQEGAAISPYAVSKWMNEETAAVFARCYDMEFVGLRYFNVYGSRQDPNGPYAAVIPKFFAACKSGKAPMIYGNGEQSRDFTYVADVVRANMLASIASTEGAIALNVGAGSTTTVTELAMAIIAATGAKVKPTYTDVRAGDVMYSRADFSRAQGAIGWSATVSLDEGLAQTEI